ncbi:4-hydroxy-tetrahydrodipicolinate reductase [Bacteroidetes bacterium endosymbiont of Geopemphigus sp.]|uniref:4-hydroxy-tetrahydrodipicolinate reductase n=1 Tax=Bacteroidetes bacterium endosymbiont of Geopemphigus sp. TaxID=2047937 RepID=UPI000CD016C8|nr:4-hydroxy-tetrahydrodipicolinate reductase [Bacteroidetes bacterium endosymbiont of Geopemphigus sp.]
MKIALIGHGKMGKTIEKIALKRQHEISLTSNHTPDSQALNGIDVAIEFSCPEAAFENIKICLENNIPVVCGTTGWLKKRLDIEQLCKKREGAFLYASNFSIGVNLFFEINRQLAQLIAPYKEYKAEIHEVHHIEKKDAPSGTALTLAEMLLEKGIAKEWILESKEVENQLLITSKRLDQTPGTHTVCYRSVIDDISLEHKAHSREGFALGAVIAAEWIREKKGVFSMKEVLSIDA